MFAKKIISRHRICLSCRNITQLGGSYCPNCGNNLGRELTPSIDRERIFEEERLRLEARDKLKKRKWGRRFVAIVIIFGLAYSISSDPRVRESLGNLGHAGGKPVETTLAIGDIKQVSGRKDGNLLLFKDQRTIEAWINAVTANDEGAAYLIGFSDMAIPIPDQTKVTVIDTALSHTSPPLNIAQVRILEGRYYGSIGWAQANNLR